MFSANIFTVRTADLLKKLIFMNIIGVGILITNLCYAWDPLDPQAAKGVSRDWSEGSFQNPSERTNSLEDYPNIRVNSDSTVQLQNEEQIAVNPLNPNNVVAVWRDFRLGYRQVGYGYSMDGGYTWNDALFEGTPYSLDSDPALTVNSEGVFFAAILGFESISQPNGLFAYRSTDGGVSWNGPFTIIDNVPGVFEDKELIACDRSDGQYHGRLYVVWARFYGSGKIMVSRSLDGGKSWLGPVNVDDNNAFQYPVCAVGPQSEVYIAWIGSGGISFDRSYDGGVTFGNDTAVVSTGLSGNINGGIDVFTFPAMDVDLSRGLRRGTIYIAYMDWNVSDTDIFFIKSADQGLTWTTPMRINDDPPGNGCDQFHPWLFVDHDGVVSVAWLDRRHDPNNLLMDCYFTRSPDGGETWSANERITSVSSNPTAGSKAGLLGEYIGLSGTQNRINVIWTDTRNGNQDAYATVIQFSSSDVPTLSGKTLVLLIIVFLAIINIVNQKRRRKRKKPS